MSRFIRPLLPLLFLLATAPSAWAAPPKRSLHRDADGLTLRVGGGYLRLQGLADTIVRVTFSPNPSFADRPSLVRVPTSAPPPDWELREGKDAVHLITSRLDVEVERSTGRVRFMDPLGRVLLAERPRGRVLEPAVVQGEKTFHVRQAWEGGSDEALYGLGQHQAGLFNLKGYDLSFYQHNTEVFVPFLVSSRGYGLLWDNASYTRFGDLGDFTPIPPENLLTPEGVPGGLTVRPFGEPAAVTSEISDSLFPFAREQGKHPPDTVWEGFLLAPETGDYQLQCFHTGELRVTLDGHGVMNHLKRWVPGIETVRVRLEAGRRYPIRIEWKTQEGKRIEFKWKRPHLGDDTAFWSEVGDGSDYTFVYGPALDDVVAGYRFVTGRAPLPPAWAFGLWQSRQRYETAQQGIEAAQGLRSRGIPFDVLVQDWRYWKEGEWGSHDFDPARFPDPEGWLKSLHDLHAHVVISVWGKYYPGTENFTQLRDHGCLLPWNLRNNVKDWLGQPYAYYDAFNPFGRKLFWDQINRGLYRRGVDGWWMDASEPELTGASTLDDLREGMSPNALGTGARTLNAYPLLNSRGIWEGQRLADPEKRVMILTRSAFAGMQRYGAAVWSGDITSTWETFAKQVPAGLGFSLSGLPYWTTDVGGYMMPTRFFPWKATKEDEDEWRELNVRWFQFGVFCPILRVHGEMRAREMWELGGEKSPHYLAELLADRLRYRLFPYVYSTAANVTFRGETFLRPLVMDFPGDPAVRDLGSEYLFGHSLLVAPVTAYRAREWDVYLPAGTAWYDWWTGKRSEGGVTIRSEAPLDHPPVFVRAGAVLTLGPDRQYIGEKPSDPITLAVYEGADGAFTLYEDDGETTRYENKVYSVIPIRWDNAAQTLVLGERQGTFKGVLETRTFHVVRVGANYPAGYPFVTKKPLPNIPYDGHAVTLHLE